MKADPLSSMPGAVESTAAPAIHVLDDLFRYQDRYLEDLGFTDSIETLGETAARRRLGDLWRAREQRSFPNPGATHSLALLLYWEARGSGRNEAQLPSPPDSTDRLWTGALRRFAALCASEAFWIEWGVLAGRIEEVRDGGLAAALADRLSLELETIATRLHERGDQPAAARFEGHLALFRAELEAAQGLPDLRILSGRGLSPAAIVAGPLLLADVGMLEKVQEAIAPQRPELLPLFDRHAWIQRLVQEERYEAALHALERLGPAEREEPAVRGLEEVALTRGAEQALRGGRVEDAVRHWNRALRVTELVGPLRSKITTIATEEAASLQGRGETGAAIELMERVDPLVEDPGLRTLLSAALVRRAGERLQGPGREEEAPGDLDERHREARSMIADLERALELDPENRAAQGSLDEARLLLDERGAENADATAPSADQAAAQRARGIPTATGGQGDEDGRSLLFYGGGALWVGITLLVLVAYPLVLPRALGGMGVLVVLALAGGWLLVNLAGFMVLRS